MVASRSFRLLPSSGDALENPRSAGGDHELSSEHKEIAEGLAGLPTVGAKVTLVG